MLAWRKTGTVRTCATAGPAGGGAAGIYRRCAAGLYEQALLALGDSALAGDVVHGVIVDECTLPPAPSSDEDEARYRLAEPVFRRYRQLAADPPWPDRRPGPRPSRGLADGMDPGSLLGEEQREALGLALSGGLGYVRASRILGTYPRDMAALLNPATLGAAIKSARGVLRDVGHRCRACGSGPADEG